MSNNEKILEEPTAEQKVDKKLPHCKLNEKTCKHFRPGRRCAGEFFNVTIDEEKQKPNYETIGVNGFTFQVKRGEVVKLPSCAVGVLECAIGTRYIEVQNKDTGHNDLVPKKHSAIPWRIARV